MNKLIVGVAVALVSVTSQAAADGIDRRPPPSIAAPAPIYAPSWSGFYVGAGFGAGAVVHDLSIRDEFGSLLHFDGVGGDGVFGTVIAGWDWQLGPKAVLGAFVDYDFSDISTDFSAFDNFFSVNVDHNHTWSVGARLGFLATPSSLVYALGGYTQAEFEATARMDGVTLVRPEKTFEGYFVGAGVDTRLGPTNWFARLEYRFTQFDRETVFRDDLLDLRAGVEPSMHTGRLTLTYKFTPGAGWGGWGNSGWNNY